MSMTKEIKYYCLVDKKKTYSNPFLQFPVRLEGETVYVNAFWKRKKTIEGFLKFCKEKKIEFTAEYEIKKCVIKIEI